MDRGDRFFFAVNAAVAVWGFVQGGGLIFFLNLSFALWLITKPLAERR